MADSFAVKKQFRRKGNDNSATTFISDFTDKIHYKKYQGFNSKFWQHIQDFHDNDDNWNDSNEPSNKKLALTKSGKASLERLIKKLSNLHYIYC